MGAEREAKRSDLSHKDKPLRQVLTEQKNEQMNKD